MNNYYTNGTSINKDEKGETMKQECCHQEMPQCGMMCDPIYECPQERVCHRVINYEVPQE